MASQTGSTGLREAFEAAVREAAQRLHVPGVAAGVIHGGEEHHVFTGVTSIENPLAVDENTLFQIGSTGKTFTATAVMRLCDEGRIDLDAPVRAYVPELKLRDEGVASTVTVLQLLNHTAGWDGDFFEDQGDGDDALERYVRRMRTLKQVVQPGQGSTASYNNAAVALAGRVIEKITGTAYEKAVTDLVLEPVGLHDSLFFPNDIMCRRFAVGHVNGEEAGDPLLRVSRPWRMLRAANPMGGLSSTLADTLRWARFHMGDGTGADGQRVLTAESLALMRRPTAPLPVALGDTVGISWLIKRVGDVEMIGHGGTTQGQHSAFQMVPERSFAVAVNTNSTNGGALHREMVAWALKNYLDVVEAEEEPLTLGSDALAIYAGRYESDSSILTVRVSGDHLEIHTKPTARLIRIMEKAGQETPKRAPVIPLKVLPNDLVVVSAGPAKGVKGQFERANGDVSGLNFGGRLAVRRS